MSKTLEVDFLRALAVVAQHGHDLRKAEAKVQTGGNSGSPGREEELAKDREDYILATADHQLALSEADDQRQVLMDAIREKATAEVWATVEETQEEPIYKPPTFAQLWLKLTHKGEDSGVIRISDISSVIRLVSAQDRGHQYMLAKGVLITMKSGEEVTAPDAILSEVEMALMAAGVGA